MHFPGCYYIIVLIIPVLFNEIIRVNHVKESSAYGIKNIPLLTVWASKGTKTIRRPDGLNTRK